MDKNQMNGQDILIEKQMDESYQIKEMRHFELPIAKHQIVVNYKARFKYSIIEYQTLRFIAISQKIQSQDEIVAALGLSKEDVEQILTTLTYDRVIEKSNDVIAVTPLGNHSFEDGYSPLRQELKKFDFYYEPISSFVVKDIHQFQVQRNPYHPIIHSENYRLLSCPRIDETEIATFYEEIFGQSLTRNTKDFTVDSIQHEGVETSYSIAVQDLQLFDLEKGQEIRSVWNSKNKRFIHLA